MTADNKNASSTTVVYDVKGNPEEYTKLYTNQQRLQSGSYGTVYVTKDNKTSKEYAVKVIDRLKFKNPQKDNNAVLREVDVMKNLQGYEGVIGLIDFFITKPTYYVVLELAKGGDVFDKLGKLTVYTELDARDLAINLLTTIDYMHNTAHIVHRDLKPENLLLKDTIDDTNIRVADFGFATKIPPQTNEKNDDGSECKYLATRCGTPAFVAPEILIGEKYGKEVDMWSIGVIIYMLLGGYPPFQDPNHKKLFRKIRAADYVFHDKYWKQVSTEAKQLIAGLLTVNPQYRITAKQALNCDWLLVKEDSLSERDLSGSLDEIQQYSPKSKLKSAVHAIGFASTAKFWNSKNVAFNKWDSMFYALEDYEKKYDNNESNSATTSAATTPAGSATSSNASAPPPARASIKKNFKSTYDINKQVRKGSSATVYECQHKESKEIYAVKVIHREGLSSDDDEDIMNEVAVLQSLNNEYIIKLIDFYEEDFYFYIVFEYMVGGDVFDSIVEKTKYTELDTRDVIKCLLKAVSYMHSCGVAHRDLKPQNLLLTSNDPNCTTIKVADFGFAKRVHTPKSLTTRCGTPTYVAPEILKNIPHDCAVDMWSVGVITYVLLVGYPPFANENQADLFRSIRTGDYEFHKDDWKSISNEAKDLIKKLLIVDPTERISADEALRSDWMLEGEITNTMLSSNDLSITQTSIKASQKSRKFRSLAAAVRWVVSSSSSSSKATKGDNKNGTTTTTTTTNKDITTVDEDGNIEIATPIEITNGIKDRNLLDLSPINSSNEIV